MHRSFLSTFRFILAAVPSTVVTGCGESSIAGCTGDEIAEERQISVADFIAAIEDGAVSLAECAELCDVAEWEYVGTCSVALKRRDPILSENAGGSETPMGDDTDAATLAVECETSGAIYVCEGRRHLSWRRPRSRARVSSVGRWLSEAAANEAASVRSFGSLARELSGRCSPRLVALLRRAAKQEVGHARLLTSLAVEYGCRRPRTGFVSTGYRSLLEIAVENAKEGCVSETLSGLIAAHQSQQATDPAVRRAFTVIASEEAEHAQLAWELHGELRRTLRSDEQRTLQHELQRAIDRLAVGKIDFGIEDGSQVGKALGLPSAAAAAVMSELLASDLRARAHGDPV